MALITCPECGKEVSSAAKTCPNCGFPISNVTNDKILIKIDQHPSVLGCIVPIKDENGFPLAQGKAGSTVEIRSKKPIKITFCGTLGKPQFTTTVSPSDGGRYQASWGIGMFQPVIRACQKVDHIDS